jgi:peptide/nickel transport system permease protein
MSRLPRWLSWLIVRGLSGALTTLALSAIVFFATHALPSDPARVILGPEATDESVQILARQLGLDLPLAEQYVHWLEQALHGDLGLSLSTRRPVFDLVADRVAATLILVSLVMGVALVFAVAGGTFLAVRSGSLLDRVTVNVLIGIKAVPVFATGIGLVMLLSTSVFSLLPAVSLLDISRPIFSQLDLLVLPALTLVLSSTPYLARLARASMIETLDSDYVLQARLRGIPERRVLFFHALPNAVIPVLQGAALTSSVLFSGGLVVEVLFNYPGLGSLLNQAVESRDLPIIQAVVLVVATGVVSINLVADLLTVLLTPRLRTQGQAQAARRPAGASEPQTATSSP